MRNEIVVVDMLRGGGLSRRPKACVCEDRRSRTNAATNSCWRGAVKQQKEEGNIKGDCKVRSKRADKKNTWRVLTNSETWKNIRDLNKKATVRNYEKVHG